MFDITKTKAVLWDLDDTLYDRQAAAALTFPGMFRAHLYENRSEEFIRQAVSFMMTQVKRHNLVHPDAFGALLEKYPPDREYIREDCLQYYYDHMYTFAVPFPRQVKVLKALCAAGVKNALVTNILPDRVASQRRKFAHLGISEYFDVVIFSGEIGIHKPDRRIYDLAAAQLGVENAACVFVGDDPDSDIAGALQAGMEAVWLDRFAEPHPLADNPRVHRVTSRLEYFPF